MKNESQKKIETAGHLTLVGFPNSGKSTLFNRLLDQKLSIVSAKPQTTRKRIRGFLEFQEKHQMIISDSPGIVESTSGINPFLKEESLSSLAETHVILLVIALDTTSRRRAVELMERVQKYETPWALVITKGDLVEFQPRRQILKEELNRLNEIATREKKQHAGMLFEYSTEWGKESKKIQDDLLVWASHSMPKAKGPIFDADDLTDLSLKEICEELIREKVFLLFEQEIPYQSAVQIRKFDESKSSQWQIYADLVVNKESHKKMAIGVKGQMIKKLSQSSRKAIIAFLKHPVRLDLQVKCKPQWHLDKTFMKEMGYVSTKK